MKLYDFTAEEFAALLDRTRGHISLFLDEGPLTINGKLSQLYSIRLLLDQSEDGIFSPELLVEDEEDRHIFLRYLTRRCKERSGWN